ncbi:hypothetical protein PNIG_a1620 [Pseudoalteromonas nigrifaciens]|uniref:WYL domain-containing protein n=1 Tax=Pseudoalteromonas nigrifaciens TaxID=28109 RepID=A0AAC9UHF8_9GAMM|nr:WYL domain-containing protein [Pseudoalteromonas nigrifaciens]ASM53758.1 hypothetical protein PNIG_a1620 [Pseudoalteromonas nigrifaciens]GEN40750.1 hypothetical protein PNI02_02160 [Pseudoalteromonas nigrifaciens]SUC52399.1 Uncharacterised protein [Pseudoalteromonas nigrifaciens]
MDYTYFQNEKGNFTAKKLPTAKGKFISIKDESDQADFQDEIKEHKPRTIDEFITGYGYYYDDSTIYDVDLETFEEAIQKNKGNWLGDKKWLSTYWAELLDYVIDLEDGGVTFKNDWSLVSDIDAEELISTGLFQFSKSFTAAQWKVMLKKNKVNALRQLAEELEINADQKKEPLVNELTKVALKQSEKINTEIVHLQVSIKPMAELKESLKWAVDTYINDIQQALKSFDYPKMYIKAVWEHINPYNNKTHLGKLVSQEIKNIENSNSLGAPINNQESWIDAKTKHTLKPAIKIAFEYTNQENEATRRELRLDAIMFENGLTYFYGFCYLANATRTFRADRIEKDIAIVETGELISVEQLIKQQLEGLNNHSNENPLAKSVIQKANAQNKEKSSLFNNNQKQSPTNNQAPQKPSKSSVIVGWLLGLAAIGGAGSNFENKEFFAGMMCFFAIFLVIPPILNKLNAKNKKMAEEKGAISSNLTQKSANIFGLILILIAAFIGS